MASLYRIDHFWSPRPKSRTRLTKCDHDIFNWNHDPKGAFACVDYLPSQILVMVVDDDVLERMCAAYMFEDAGYRVLAAGSADEALLGFEATADIRVLFTDVSMPGAISGADLAHQVAARWPQTGIIMTSGRPRPNQMRPGTRFHAKPYLPTAVLLHASELIKAAGLQHS